MSSSSDAEPPLIEAIKVKYYVIRVSLPLKVPHSYI